ncbi:MAG: RidA family protein [Armatimonadetes bacterium]|nr:RidA family protein [Armatimonadota bacterium]
MPNKAIQTSSAPQAIGPYSQGISSGGFVFISGQLPIDPNTGDLVRSTIEEETTIVLENIKAVLSAAGADVSDVVKTTIFLTDINDFPRVNEVYASYFETNPPARATVGVAALPKGARVEIEAIAALV